MGVKVVAGDGADPQQTLLSFMKKLVSQTAPVAS